MKNTPLFFPYKYFLGGSFLYWIFFTCAYLAQNYAYNVNTGRKTMWAELLSYLISENLINFLLCNCIFFLYLHTRTFQWKPFLRFHFIMAIIYGMVFISLSMLLIVTVRWYLGILKESYLQTLSNYLFSMSLFAISGFSNYWFWIIVLLGIDFYLKFRLQQVKSIELESRLNRSQLQALKMQLQPHFLFNALHTIAMMVRRQKNEEAVEMISGLSDLLRNTLTNSAEQLVTLEDELHLLKKYLYIEQVRFKDKFAVEYCIQPESLACQVPNLLLQPIVENAFKYGIAKSMQNALLRISSKQKDNYLIINIFNTDSHLPDNWKISENQGVGLSNTLARLQQLYGQNFEFTLQNTESDSTGVEVNIKIPCK
jgi:sensor histidine kinase YesM